MLILSEGKRGIILMIGTVLLSLLIVIAGCGDDESGSSTKASVIFVPSPAPVLAFAYTAGGADMKGTVEIDGSSTVYPISEAVAEEFNKLYPKVRVNVGVSGTGGGFKRFYVGETDISDASRPMEDKEKVKAEENDITYVELRIGTDGLSVLVNPDNDFVDCLTIEELKKIWEPGSQVNNWSQIRVGFPDQKIRLYGPDTDSGTFDYFTEEVMGEAQLSRADYTASADDNVLIQGITGDKGSLGYFGYAYYEENQDKLKLVEVDSGSGCVAPSPTTISSGEYSPLSRPLFIYVNNASLARPEVKALVDFYMEHGPKLINEVGYVASNASVYANNKVLVK
jgi:phosphate transport system substrate-binding protein